MTNTFDCKSLRQPTFRLEMDDAEETIIHVAVPSVDIVDRLRANLPELLTLVSGDSAASKQAIFELAATLISCNTDAIGITAHDLIHRFDWDVALLSGFYTKYLNFIEEIEHAKN